MKLGEQKQQRILRFLYSQGKVDIRLGNLEGKTFAIVESWGDLSKIHEAINARFARKAWAQWRPVYDTQQGRSPYEDLRLGHIQPICPQCGKSCGWYMRYVGVNQWKCSRCGLEIEHPNGLSPIRYGC